KVLALQIATHQSDRREPAAEQHCGCSAVRNPLTRGKGKFNLLYLFKVTHQGDRLDRLPVKRDNPLPCEIAIRAKATEGKSLCGVSLIILYHDGHRPVRIGEQLATE